MLEQTVENYKAMFARSLNFLPCCLDAECIENFAVRSCWKRCSRKQSSFIRDQTYSGTRDLWEVGSQAGSVCLKL